MAKKISALISLSGVIQPRAGSFRTPPWVGQFPTRTICMESMDFETCRLSCAFSAYTLTSAAWMGAVPFTTRLRLLTKHNIQRAPGVERAYSASCGKTNTQTDHQNPRDRTCRRAEIKPKGIKRQGNTQTS